MRVLDWTIKKYSRMTRKEALNTVLAQTSDRTVYVILEVKETTAIVAPCVGLQVGEKEEYEYPLSELEPVNTYSC